MIKTLDPQKIKTEWDLALLYAGDADPRIQADLDQIEASTRQFVEKWEKREDYLQDPKILREALDEYEKWASDGGVTGNVGYYWGKRYSLDQSSTEVKAQLNKLNQFSRKLWNTIRFFSHRISLIPADKQAVFLNSPELQKYKHYLEEEFAGARFLLSEPEEKIVNLKAQTGFGNWVRMTSQFIAKEESELEDEKGETKLRSFSEIMSLIDSKDKKVRDAAALALNTIFAKHIEVGEHEINSILGYEQVEHDLRKIERPDLPRHISDDIDTEIVDTLLETVTSRFALAQKYYQLKAKLMGVDKLQYHERNVDYGEIDIEFTYEKAVELVNETLEGLDPRFSEIFRKFLENGQIDAYPKKGKTNGAYCAYGPKKSSPTMILLNFTNTFGDILTIAHEVGHGINNTLAKESQHALSDGTSLAIAEVASTFMEDFVLQKALESADEETRLAIYMQKLNDEISTIMRQVACYSFEQELHKTFREKGYLSHKEIGEIFLKHMSSYMGDAVEMSPGAENWWVYWSHIRDFFYVYSYSSGLLISKAMQKAVKADPKFIEKVKEFLSAGSVDSPKNIFAKMGIDITQKSFWEQGLSEVTDLLEETEKLARKLAKI